MTGRGYINFSVAGDISDPKTLRKMINKTLCFEVTICDKDFHDVVEIGIEISSYYSRHIIASVVGLLGLVILAGTC